MSYTCCKSKPFASYVCINCLRMVHKSCFCRARSKYRTIKDHLIECCTTTHVENEDTDKTILETTLRDLCEETQSKTEHIQKLKRDYKTMLEEAVKNETELNEIINNQKEQINYLLSEIREHQQLTLAKSKEFNTSTTQTQYPSTNVAYCQTSIETRCNETQTTNYNISSDTSSIVDNPPIRNGDQHDGFQLSNRNSYEKRMHELADSIVTLKQEIEMLTFINTQFEKEVIRLIDDNTHYSQELNQLHKMINSAENKNPTLKQKTTDGENDASGNDNFKVMENYSWTDSSGIKNSGKKRNTILVVGDEYARNIPKTIDNLLDQKCYNVQGYVYPQLDCLYLFTMLKEKLKEFSQKDYVIVMVSSRNICNSVSLNFFIQKLLPICKVTNLILTYHCNNPSDSPILNIIHKNINHFLLENKNAKFYFISTTKRNRVFICNRIWNKIKNWNCNNDSLVESLFNSDFSNPITTYPFL